MVHRLHDQGEAARPVVAVAGKQADADGIAPGHQPIAVVLDLVDPIGAGRGLVGGRRQARLNIASRAERIRKIGACLLTERGRATSMREGESR